MLGTVDPGGIMDTGRSTTNYNNLCHVDLLSEVGKPVPQ